MGIRRIGAAVLIVVVGSSFPQGRLARAEEKAAPRQGSDESTDLIVRDVTTRSPDEQRIHDLLDRPARLRFRDYSLRQVAAAISDSHGIPVRTNMLAVDGLGQGARRPFSIDADEVPLRKALQLLFDGRFLDYYIQGKGLHITSRDDVRSRQEIRVYDVGPLLRDGSTAQDVADLLNSGRLLKNSAPAQPIGGLVAVAGNRHVHDSILNRLRATDAETVLVFRATQPPVVRPFRLPVRPPARPPAGGRDLPVAPL